MSRKLPVPPPPPYLDPRVWDLASKKLKRRCSIRVLLGLAALEPEEAIDLLAMKTADRDRFGGIPHLSWRTAQIVWRDQHGDDRSSDRRFRQMLSEIILSPQEHRDFWMPGDSDPLKVMWLGCPMLFVAAMSQVVLDYQQYEAEREEKALGYRLKPGKLTNETQKMAEDAMRVLSKPSFVPKASSYRDPFPWLSRFSSFDLSYYAAAELLQASERARIQERNELLAMEMIRSKTPFRWTPDRTESLTAADAGSSLNLVATLVHDARARTLLYNPTQSQALRYKQTDDFSWLANGLLSANVASDRALLDATAF